MSYTMLLNLRNGIRKYTVAVLFSIFFLAPNGFARENPDSTEEQTPEFTVGSEVDFPSRYIWHGLAWSHGIVMQPYLWMTTRGFTFTGFANFDIDHASGKNPFNEVDLTLTYSREWKKITFEPDFQYYVYPNQENVPATGEGVLKISFPIKYLQLFTIHTFDLVEYKGSYFGELGITFTHEFNATLSLETSLYSGWASAAFNEVYVGPHKSAFNVVGGDLSFTYYYANQLYIRPYCGISHIVDKNLQNSVSDKSLILFGLGIGADL